ncbi:hypothetical protein [Hydrogenivirga sp.]
MEGRRIEGVFLDSAILRNKAYEAYETAKVYEIRILSRVPEALLASLGDTGSRFSATVKSLEGSKVVLLLENGYEVEAENKLSMPVKVGEELSLVLESKNPLTLRVERAFSGIRGIRELISLALGMEAPPVEENDIKGFLQNSGLVYEKKVWDFLRGALGEEGLSRDFKFQVLSLLNRAETGGIEKVLREARLPQELQERVSALFETSQKGEKLRFFRELTQLEGEISSRLKLNEQRLSLINNTLREITSSLLNSFVNKANRLGLRLNLNRELFSAMEANPKTLSIFQEAIKSLESNQVREFAQKLALVGVRVENPEQLPLIRENLLSTLRELVRGATTLLSSKLDTEDVNLLTRQVKELGEEIEHLSEFREKLTNSLPKEVKDNLTRLENINYFQSFFTAWEGRKFVVPFGGEEGKGLFAFSMKESFRIFVRLSFDEGFLGVVIEAPKKEEPDFINVLFKTDIGTLQRELEASLPSLERELSELGLEVRRIEVLKYGEGSFDRELAEELGEAGMFNLRV